MSSFFDENTPDIVLKSLFNKYDTDGSGSLSTKELPDLLQNDLGLSVEESEMYTLLLDKDANGRLSFDEFKKWLNSGEKLQNLDSERYNTMYKAVEMFKKYDMDASGALECAEFSKLCVELGGQPEHAQSAMNSLDNDGNNKISFLEFMKWLNWIDVSKF